MLKPSFIIRISVLFLIHKIECVCMLSRISHVLLIATLWTVAHQASLSVGFSRQEYCSGLLVPSPEDLPDPRMEPLSHASPTFQVGSLPTEPPENIVYSYFLKNLLGSQWNVN